MIMKKQITQAILKPVSKSSTQYATLCDIPSGLVSAYNAAYSALNNCQWLSQLDRFLLECQLLSGCRVSQLLKINYNNISNFGQVLIPGSKGSNQTVVTVTITKDYAISIANNKIQLSGQRNRFYLYRLWKRLGISVLNEGDEKYRVTHALRHSIISGMSSINVEPNVIKNEIGHKNVNSQVAYIHKTKKNEKDTTRDSLQPRAKRCADNNNKDRCSKAKKTSF